MTVFKVKAIVEKVGINFGVEVPLSGEQTSAGKILYQVLLNTFPFIQALLSLTLLLMISLWMLI